MNRYGLFSLALGAALVATTASAAEPAGALWPQTTSRRTATRPFAVVAARLTASTTNAYRENAAAGDEASPSDQAPVEGAPLDAGIYAGYGYSRDLSGWGNCDSCAPCTSHLWAGYVQRPLRCHPHKAHWGSGGCGAACNTCAPVAHCKNRYRHHGHGCSTCDNGCGGFSISRIFGHHRGACATACDSCTLAADPGCATPIEAAPLEESKVPPAPVPEGEQTLEDTKDNSVFHVPTPSLRSSRPFGLGLK